MHGVARRVKQGIIRAHNAFSLRQNNKTVAPTPQCYNYNNNNNNPPPPFLHQFKHVTFMTFVRIIPELFPLYILSLSKKKICN